MSAAGVSSRYGRVKEDEMNDQLISAVDRRRFLTRVMPACSLACLSAGNRAAFAANGGGESTTEGLHKFDVPTGLKMTSRERVTQENDSFIRFIKTLQSEMDDGELIRLLNIFSAGYGRDVGTQQAKASPDTSFTTFTNTFRPPNYGDSLTLEIAEDTDKVFQLEVTECVWAKVFRDAGLGGEIGHAAVCNMDYHWPQAFNKNFKMERTKTLMRGDERCNHRYLDTT
jgi:hypothetical protein